MMMTLAYSLHFRCYNVVVGSSLYAATATTVVTRHFAVYHFARRQCNPNPNPNTSINGMLFLTLTLNQTLTLGNGKRRSRRTRPGKRRSGKRRNGKRRSGRTRFQATCLCVIRKPLRAFIIIYITKKAELSQR